jgi:adenosylhomocysteinase
MESQIKHPELAEQGKLNLELAERNMAALLRVRDRFAKEKPFAGMKIGMALHITKETGILVRTLVAGGAQVAITGCNPLSTQDDVAAALAVEPGVLVYGYKGENSDDYYKYLNAVIDFEPNITIDDGCDLVTELITKRTDKMTNLIGGCEETTTGVIRLRAMEKDGVLKFPVVAVNDNKTKHLMDNYYGTGQSTLDGVVRASNVLLAGKTLVVLGYGSCGKGVALRARGMGANVIVTEIDPFRALQATMDGFRVMTMEDAAKIGDIFITVTGNKHVIRVEHMKAMKTGAILANSGHFDIEIDVAGLEKVATKRRVRPYFDEYAMDGKVIFLAGEGRLVNLASAEGHPSEVMSLSFCGQALACEYLVKNKATLEPKVYVLPDNIDEEISRYQLEAMGLKIDELTAEQKSYLSSWDEGTK